MLFHQPMSSFINHKIMSKRFFSINRRTSPSNSQEFRSIILDQCGHVLLSAPGTPGCWASPWPPQGTVGLALSLLRNKLFILVRCPSEEDCTSLQVSIHLLCCCSHLKPQPANSKMAAPSFLLSACCLESSGPRRDLITSVVLLIWFLCNLFRKSFLSCRRKTKSWIERFRIEQEQRQRVIIHMCSCFNWSLPCWSESEAPGMEKLSVPWLISAPLMPLEREAHPSWPRPSYF